MNVLTTAGSFWPFDKERSQTVSKKKHQTALAFGPRKPIPDHEVGRSVVPGVVPRSGGQILRQRNSRRFSTNPILGRDADRYPGPDTQVSDHPRGVR